MSRRAEGRVCRCGARVVSGFDSAVAGIWRTVDAVPLSPWGVRVARLGGFRVFGLSLGMSVGELFVCESEVAPWGCVMVPAHRCGWVPPPDWWAVRGVGRPVVEWADPPF